MQRKMLMITEEKLLQEIEILKRENLALKAFQEKLEDEDIPIFSFSNMTDRKLKECVLIQREFNNSTIFDEWFSHNSELSSEEIAFLESLIEKYSAYLDGYKEETLKAHFVIPILNRVDFLLPEYRCAGLYEERLTYKTEKFIFNGTTDFVFAKGLVESEKPYFFIQEFKRGEENSSPRPQLLAELISAIELNNETSMKGAYIVGAIWNFVIVEKLGKDSYRYFVSRNFDSTDIEKLKMIYKNLLFIKDMVIQRVKNEG